MKPIKHRKLAYLIVLVLMLLVYVLYIHLRVVGFLSLEHDYIPYCIGSLGVSAIFFIRLKGRVG